MKFPSLLKGALLGILMTGAGTLVLMQNPPSSARQEQFNRWLAQVHDSKPQSLTFALREDRGEGHPTEYTLSGVDDSPRIMRLAQLAQEAELFQTEPLTEVTPTPDEPVTELLLSGAGEQFFYRDRRSRFAQSIPARALRKLAEVYTSEPSRPLTDKLLRSSDHLKRR
jgi:hypothetical protein